MISGAANAVESDPPEVIAGRYKVLRVLGRGGMATVYLCDDMPGGAKVAVKVLRQEIGSAVVVERFVREISFATEIDHPRIPKVLDSGIVDGLPFYVMTYIEGESLRDLLARKKQLTIDEAVRIAADVIEPIAYAHARGIVHRDIKPENILLAPDGVYVLDFGVARAILESAADRLTSTGVAVGTPAYMSPEQALSDKDLDTRSDVYSLGCVVYETIAGIPPFVGATAQAVMSRRFVAPAPPLSETRDGVPSGVERAVAKALARTPADRWQTVEEFGSALTAPPLSESVQEVKRHIDRRRVWYLRGVVATITLTALAIAGFAYTGTRRASVIRAQAALVDWDLERAEAQFRLAVSQRPGDAFANLWLAQTLMLRHEPLEDLRPFLATAADRRNDLGSSDQKRLDALALFAAGNFRAACPVFEQLRSLARAEHRDDYTPVLAFGDCLHADSSAVQDSSSPSGYRFATSYHFLDSLYESLLFRNRAKPGAYGAIMPRLESVLAVDPREVRRGTANIADGELTVWAQAALLGDTITYIPYPQPDRGAVMEFGASSALEAARNRNRNRLKSLSIEWTNAFPDDPSGREMLAGILEAGGEITGGDQNALDHLAEARGTSAVSDDESADGYIRRLRLATAHVRNLIRSGEYKRAGTLADSAGAWRRPQLPPNKTHAAEQFLWRLAAVRGRVGAVIEIEHRYASRYQVQLPAGREVLPTVLGRDAISVGNYAAFGGPVDSVRTIAARFAKRVESLVAPSRQEAVKRAVLTRPLLLAVPFLGARALSELGPSADPVVRAVLAQASGNDRLARLYDADREVPGSFEYKAGKCTRTGRRV